MVGRLGVSIQLISMILLTIVSTTLRGACRRGGFPYLFIPSTGKFGICPGMFIFRRFYSTFSDGLLYSHMLEQFECGE